MLVFFSTQIFCCLHAYVHPITKILTSFSSVLLSVVCFNCVVIGRWEGIPSGWFLLLFAFTHMLTHPPQARLCCHSPDFWQSDYTYHQPHRFHEVAAESKRGTGSPNWHLSMVNIYLQRFMWMDCRGHAKIMENGWADRLLGKATLTNSVHNRGSEVLRSLRHYLRPQSQGHHTIDCQEMRGIRSAQQSALKGHAGFLLTCKDLGRTFNNSFPICSFFVVFLKVEISSRTLIPLFRPGSVNSGSASWDDCNRVFPDESRELG